MFDSMLRPGTGRVSAVARPRRPNRGRRAVGVIGVLLGLVLWPAHADIYKWVDADGRVHYGDRPDGDAATSVNIRPAPTTPPPGPEPTGAQRAERQQRLLRSMEDERLERREAREKARRDQAERERRCHLARDRQRRFNAAGYIYKLDEQGQRRVYDADERAAAQRRVDGEVSRWCD